MAKLGLAPVISGNAARLVAIGELTPGTTTAVEQAVNELFEEGVVEVTVDLRKVDYFDAHAIDALVAVAARACARGMAIRLCGDGDTTERLEAAKATALFAAIDEALAMADTVRALLDVCANDDAQPPIEAVTWLATDEPTVPTR